MKLMCSVLLLCWSVSLAAEVRTTRNDLRKFPDGFLFGTATASYQVEGAWDEDGKTENIWDHMTHTHTCIIQDCSNGDVADDSYHQYERDVEMMRELGLDFYRFSLSWPRLLPSGFADRVNEAGVAYYNNLINEMLKYNIEPMITLYHWDLPQRLQDLGGWANPHIVDWFGDYARVAFEQFGDRVKYWLTINEPREICYQGYGATEKAPVLNVTGIGDYLCAKNLLLAHARAYHIYDDDFRSTNGGAIGISFSAKWYEPETDSEEDILAAEEQNQFEWNEYVHPIYSETGDFPPIMKEKIAAKSVQQGFPRSRNESVYQTRPVPSFYDDLDTGFYQPSDWESAASSWLKICSSETDQLDGSNLDQSQNLASIGSHTYGTDMLFSDIDPGPYRNGPCYLTPVNDYHQQSAALPL
ncbi:Myrosinase 1 [Eumeta japonica]|uniref:Myrosinase 1 n=1 Tax=Eumeta variegata TaxID=151549 RepID=A0A4C1SXP9_EUMVA|nr:Myrosinase 1 [Eumeta japonica]